MSKRVLILKGSPREKGNSATLADQVMAGAKDVQVEAESFYLHSMDIRPCDACDLCRENDNACVIQDDMQILYPKLIQADGIVIASPIYWFTFSAQTKLCIDRWYALQTPSGNALAGKQMGLLLTYEDSDPYTSGAINAIRAFQDMVHYLEAEVVGIVYASASGPGDVRQQPSVMEQAYKLGQSFGLVS